MDIGVGPVTSRSVKRHIVPHIGSLDCESLDAARLFMKSMNWVACGVLLCLCFPYVKGNGDAEIAFDAALPHYAVDSEITTQFPFSAVVSLSNGCTGAFVGPCHVLTAGHCTLNPLTFEFSHALTVQAIPQDIASPFIFHPQEIKVAQRWSTLSDPAHDVALLHVHDPEGLIEKHLGYLPVGNSNPEDQSMTLNIAGYPEGHAQLWYDVCQDVYFDFDERLFVDHSCHVQHGSSGSPMWYYSSEDNFREIRALHTSTLQLTGIDSFPGASRPQAIILTGRLLREIQGWIEELSGQDV